MLPRGGGGEAIIQRVAALLWAFCMRVRAWGPGEGGRGLAVDCGVGVVVDDDESENGMSEEEQQRKAERSIGRAKGE